MLLTVFRIGGAAYALDAMHLVEVLPLVHIEPIPHAPAEVAGTLNYHGAAVVVIDLHRLAGQAPALRRLSTRILIVKHGPVQIGLLAAGVTDTVKIDSEAFREATHSALGDVAWIGSRAVYGSGFIHRLELDSLVRMVGATA